MTLKNISHTRGVVGAFVAALVFSTPMVASAAGHASEKKAEETKCAAGDKACAEKAATAHKDAHGEHNHSHGDHDGAHGDHEHTEGASTEKKSY